MSGGVSYTVTHTDSIEILAAKMVAQNNDMSISALNDLLVYDLGSGKANIVRKDLMDVEDKLIRSEVTITINACVEGTKPIKVIDVAELKAWPAKPGHPRKLRFREIKL